MENQFGYFNLGKNTHTVPMALHQGTRAKLLDSLAAAGVSSAGAAVVLYPLFSTLP